MKRTKTNILCLLLAALMLFSLTACGKGDKDDKTADSNLIKLGDYEILYKDACIMEDAYGNDALVLTLDYTNNSDETDSYLWSVTETATQNGEMLDIAIVYTDYDILAMVTDDQMEDVEPGQTMQIQSAFVLQDTISEVEVEFEQVFGTKSGKITIDPSTLSRETAEGSSGDTAAAPTGSGDALLDWWNGEWYGWWQMSACYGYYEEMDMEGQWWDVCGVIDIGEDYTGTVTLWDVDYTKDDPMALAEVSLNEAGTSEYGTVMSEGGWFTDVALEHADWIVDPGLTDYENLIWIDGNYENGEDAFYYEIYLRPWGTYWDDVDADSQPDTYNDWYLPMIEAGKAMPDVIGADAPEAAADSGNAATPAPATSPSGDIPGGDGIVTDEQVQKGYVYMSEVAKDIFNTTYEELVEYFGVEGKFDKEDYSDVYKTNMRYYKWISSENPHNFIYVNFMETEPGVYEISAYNTSGFSGTEAKEKYLDIVKAEAAEKDKAAAANTAMKDFSLEVTQFGKDDVKIKITTIIPESGWSSTKDSLVENEDPDAFGAGFISFRVRESLEKLDSNKDSYKNFQEIDDRVIGGITFQGRTYSRIGYDWIEYVAQIDENRALAIGLVKLDCVPGTMPDIILNNMKFQ